MTDRIIRLLIITVVFVVSLYFINSSYERKKNEIEKNEIVGVIKSIKYDSKKSAIIYLYENQKQISLEYFGINV